MRGLSVTCGGGPVGGIRALGFATVVRSSLQRRAGGTICRRLRRRTVTAVVGRLATVQELSGCLGRACPGVRSTRRVGQRLLRRCLACLTARTRKIGGCQTSLAGLQKLLRAVKGLCKCPRLRVLFLTDSLPERIRPGLGSCSSDRLVHFGTTLTRLSRRVRQLVIVRRVLKAEVSSALALRASYLCQRSKRPVVRVQRVGAAAFIGPVDTRLRLLVRGTVRCAGGECKSAICVFISRGGDGEPVRCGAIRGGIVSLVRGGSLQSSRERLFKFKARVFHRMCNVHLARLRLSS